MFCFGCQTDEGFVFVQSDEHVYTFPTVALSQEYFDCVKTHSHLYSVDSDLSVARLLEAGDGPGAPAEVEPTEEQKLALWSSYVYKSLLAWAPYPGEVQP